jgi:hypothetical protein
LGDLAEKAALGYRRASGGKLKFGLVAYGHPTSLHARLVLSPTFVLQSHDTLPETTNPRLVLTPGDEDEIAQDTTSS